MLKAGDKAPDFSLPDIDMAFRTLEELTDRTLVLYFYPKDDTPGCTLQATEFSELLEEFIAAGARIVGISQDDCISHQNFRDKHGLEIALLADVDGEVCEKYCVIRESQKHGVTKTGILRSTFVIDSQRTIRRAQYGVSPGHHAELMLDMVKELNTD